MQKLKWPALFLVGALLMLLLTAQTFPRSPMGWVIAQRLTVRTLSEFNGAATFNGNVTQGGLSTQDPAEIVATNGMAITPISSLTVLTSTAAVTVTLGAPTTGTELELINIGSNNILIVDTGTTRMASNYTMGQYDSIRFRRIDGNWVEMGRSNN